MDFLPYTHPDLARFQTAKAVLSAAMDFMAHLEKEAQKLQATRSAAADQMLWFDEQIAVLKTYYERAERLVCDE